MEFIFEHAMTRSEITRDLKDKSEQIRNHLLYIYVWPDSPYKKHWEKEIYSILSDTYKWTKTNKYLDQETIYHYVFGYVEDIFLNNFEYYIDKIATLEDTPIDIDSEDLKPEKLLAFLKDYFYWLSQELSENGKVLSFQVYDKIAELLKKYKN